MTLFLFLSIYGISNILSNFDAGDTPVLLSMILGILGFVGLFMNLKQNRRLKPELLNFILLTFGIIGFVLFISLEGGIKAWKWIIMIEEPGEWLLFVVPLLITIFLTVKKGKCLITMHKHKEGERAKIDPNDLQS